MHCRWHSDSSIFYDFSSTDQLEVEKQFFLKILTLMKEERCDVHTLYMYMYLHCSLERCSIVTDTNCACFSIEKYPIMNDKNACSCFQMQTTLHKLVG